LSLILVLAAAGATRRRRAGVAVRFLVIAIGSGVQGFRIGLRTGLIRSCDACVARI
jgi:hypothetical protein